MPNLPLAGLGLASLMLASTAMAQPSRDERIAPSEKAIAEMQGLTPAHFAETASVRDDDLDTVAEISTASGYFDRGRFTDRVRADNFLRAFINKASGRVRYQLYQTVTYSGAWRQFTSVNYATPDGPVAAEVTEIAHDVLTCTVGLCTYRDTLGFDVPEAVLGMIAAQYEQGQSPMWRYRFIGRSGLNWEDQLLPAEAAGLLMKVEAWRAAHPRP